MDPNLDESGLSGLLWRAAPADFHMHRGHQSLQSPVQLQSMPEMLSSVRSLTQIPRTDVVKNSIQSQNVELSEQLALAEMKFWFQTLSSLCPVCLAGGKPVERTQQHAWECERYLSLLRGCFSCLGLLPRHNSVSDCPLQKADWKSCCTKCWLPLKKDTTHTSGRNCNLAELKFFMFERFRLKYFGSADNFHTDFENWYNVQRTPRGNGLCQLTFTAAEMVRELMASDLKNFGVAIYAVVV